MEALLPSEIARLVFGYLEDQKCNEAARSFLEASPHLHECRTAVLNGRRFNTRVNGYTLTDIFDKFSAAHLLVQERLNKVADCEQVKRCGDLLDQLRFLIGGSRGQRFVVNINVPSQASSQTYGGSPLITSSIRKRYHSASDRDRSRRCPKPLHQLSENQTEPVSSQLRCETVEATPLESLPGHTYLSSVPHQPEPSTSHDSDGVYCTSTKNEYTDRPPLGDFSSLTTQMCHDTRLSNQAMEQETSSGRLEKCSSGLEDVTDITDLRRTDNEENKNLMLGGKTMATSTDELTTYSSIEVQTTPYALSESESNELDDEPIENLSLLTKELLNRTELQERIAENINKAILPIEMPSKDESICESMSGEMNTSIMAELNNAIKSIVVATETDPVFENFLDEIIGPNVDTDTSPDEEHDFRVSLEHETNSRIQTEPSNTAVVDMELEEVTSVVSTKSTSSNGITELPLKHRLRSSSRQQNSKPEDERDRTKDVERVDNALEDHNAEAIRSIINANIVGNKQMSDKGPAVGNAIAAKPAVAIQSTELSQPVSIPPASQIADSTEVMENDLTSHKSSEEPAVKNLICPNSNSELNGNQINLISEQEMMAMPTLILCSAAEVRNSIKADNLSSSQSTVSYPEPRFVPIAPKGPDNLEPMLPLYLRAVHVPIQVQSKIQPQVATKVEKMITNPPSSSQVSRANTKCNRKMMKKKKNLKSAIVPTNTAVESKTLSVTNTEQTSSAEVESITLYANDNSFGTLIENAGNMPMINLDDTMALTGTGFSPYLKFHDNKNITSTSNVSSAKLTNDVPIEQLDVDIKVDESKVLPHTENILFARNTPKSLLRNRSRNNRLSMSTPRRRSNHIRALDFNTPKKSSSSEQKTGSDKSVQFSPKSSKRIRSACRTSLFKSPPFSGSVTMSQKIKTPVKDQQPYKVPIATRSPAPKLLGGWDKYTGVGMILGGTSPHPSSSSTSVEHDEPPSYSQAKSSSCTVKKSWDADLRQVLQDYQQPSCSTLLVKKGPVKVKSRVGKSCSAGRKENASKSEGSENAEQSKHGVIMDRNESKFIVKRGVNSFDEVISDEVADVSPSVANKEISLHEKRSALNTNVELVVQTDAQIVTSKLRHEHALKDEMESSEGFDVSKTKEKLSVKKYAILKTLETKISKHKYNREIESTTLCPNDSSQKKSECLKVSPETHSLTTHILQMCDLETPRKGDISPGIPPTPRMLSPSSITITPFTNRTQESSKVPGIISTPDFPPTPNIRLTPKTMEEITIDGIKKGEFGTCSPYYEPSTEQPNIVDNVFSSLNTTKKSGPEVVPVAPSMKTDPDDMLNSGVDNDFIRSTLKRKPEITQFEVIKENLSKEEADKELKISTNSTSTEVLLPELIYATPINIQEQIEDENVFERSPQNQSTDSTSLNESSKSSSSGTSSSSSTSSSCSCSSFATTSTPFKSVTKCKTKSNACDTSTDSSAKNQPDVLNTHDLISKLSPITVNNGVAAVESNKNLFEMQNTSSLEKGETSPLKVLLLNKTQEEVDASTKETPLKDEALLSEANISETPSSSKSGIENLTNLKSKLSTLDNSGYEDNSKQNQVVNKTHIHPFTRLKPKIISVQHFLPDVSLALKPQLLSEIVSSTTQPSNSQVSSSSVTLDGKLGMHLEEKRLRLMAKLKSNPQTKIAPNRVRFKQVNLNAKMNTKEKHTIATFSTYEQRKSSTQTMSDNPATKQVIQIKKKTNPNATNSSRASSKRISENESNEGAQLTQSQEASVKLISEDCKQEKCDAAQSGTKKSSNMNTHKSSTIRKKDCNAPLKSRKSIRRIRNRQVLQETAKAECDSKICDAMRNEDPLTVGLTTLDYDTSQPMSYTELNEDLGATSKIIDLRHSTELIAIVSQKCETIFEKDSDDKNDEECPVENITIPVKKSQTVQLSKVDQIKRDLFSDEENSDQRTTRSKTRQLSDTQKSEPSMPVYSAQSEPKICEIVPKKSKEELTNVLECLKLVPANKTETIGNTGNSSQLHINELGEYQFFHTDSVSIKKKRTKFRSSSLEYIISRYLDDDNGTECQKVMTSTAYEEIFNHSPRPKKRVVAKKLKIKNSKSTKEEALKPTSTLGTKFENDIIETSVVLSSSVKLKTAPSKVKKNATKTQTKSLMLTKKDDETEHEDGNPDSEKLKISDSVEDQPIEKKRRIADPQSLLKKLDLDLFLTSVHGPVGQ
ncbi:serine-rich adhesin for platelets-like isoform X2 [Neodiprion virginianus]|uniref:serine-rich adhesin for platelets-like isoform X2 n=1 Tax=Neodiprion virginianus TaxID=2961670 RepID=UPI001EE6F75E|nr:serine-rich adhesin for platelets-like isoform X2 [Neodiprion virginianus]